MSSFNEKIIIYNIFIIKTLTNLSLFQCGEEMVILGGNNLSKLTCTPEH